MASINICIWARRTGKTQGPMASFSLNNILSMPRSNGMIGATTYETILTKTLPPLMAGWERRGFKEGLHYWIGELPPEDYNIPKAWVQPVKTDHYIKWFNGSGIYLVSQDRASTINGVATQWGAFDEAKFLNYERLREEALLTLSGENSKFGHLPNYLSLLFCSDMPTNTKSKWLLDYKDQMDPAEIDMIIRLHARVLKLQEEMLTASNHGQTVREREINLLQKELREMRKDSVYFSLASTLDNIHAIGFEPIRQFKRTLDDITFATTVLNKLVFMVVNCFYPWLDSDELGYDAVNYDYVDGLGIRNATRKDCRWDSDILSHKPLVIACDYNNAINCIITGQEADYCNERRYLSSKYVLHPFMLKDCVDVWHEYYQYHPTKEIDYVYDSTAIGGDAVSDVSMADEWTDALTKKGWTVNRIDIGQLPSHGTRYFMWGKVMQGKEKNMPVFRYNRTNCQDWQISCEKAGVLKKEKKIKKDKRPEVDPKVPQNEATHLSEAGDQLFCYWYRPLFGDQIQYMDHTIG